mgnify:CR=1 FL=1
MKGFVGFPPGKTPLVLFPSAVFGELVPLIDDLAELKVTLHCYWRLSQGEGAVRFVRRRDLVQDDTLLNGLSQDATTDPVSVLDEALGRAVARATLLHVHVEREEQTEEWYFANTPKGRAAAKQAQQGQWPESAPGVIQAETTRPNIFVLYEQNIGLLQPLIADELRQAEQDYPASWIKEAFHRAAEANVRHWKYVRAILERWSREGKGDGTSGRDAEKDYRRYIEGKYADYVEY